MSATAVATPDGLPDFTAIVDAMRAVFKRIGDAFRQLARAFQPILRYLRRHGRGYSSPTPLVIDGHAYTLRRRARVRRKAWRR